ncbi:MAG: host attachment protein [Pseudomonadales bacterium]
MADSVRARFFEWAEPEAPLKEIADLLKPEGRLKEQALSSGRAGVTSSSHGHNSVRALQAAHTGHEKSEAEFAEQIDAALVRGLDAGRYDQLVLFAPPHFLGALRSHLSTRVAETVVYGKPLDLTREDLPSIQSRLRTLKALS